MLDLIRFMSLLFLRASDIVYSDPLYNKPTLNHKHRHILPESDNLNESFPVNPTPLIFPHQIYSQ